MPGENDKWEMYEDKAGEHRWRRRASNGNIVGAACEGYSQKASCKANAQRHGMDGNPNGLGSNDKWEMYEDKSGHHRWRRTASNGEKVGASSEGYANKSDCKDNAKRNGMM
ncbi:YegP family protein [Robiginitomaculum antarcticum]|uniref:YegP family protein n=1 Tax=Robiginitomaculum antarcticum TaxID=437507 RepID=UPI0003A264BE|nr:DUF1508 domain-containing protein [Robiginitomaculum antarcticum]